MRRAPPSWPLLLPGCACKTSRRPCCAAPKICSSTGSARPSPALARGPPPPPPPLPPHRAPPPPPSPSPHAAAMINPAASHVAEQDDVHNGSVFHPATVVFPPALAVAQAIGASGQELLLA